MTPALAALLPALLAIQLYYEVVEESPAGTLVGRIGGEAAVFFKLGHGMDSSYFAVERETGAIRLVCAIHRESLVRCRGARECLVSFSVGSSSLRRFGTYSVVVNIVDLNNNPPTFYPDFVSRRIDPANPFTEFALPQPYDYDSPPHGIRTCAVDPPLDWALLIPPDRMRVTNDRARGFVRVKCVDWGVPPLHGLLTIQISRMHCLRPSFDYKTLNVSPRPSPTAEMVFIAQLKAFHSPASDTSPIRFWLTNDAEYFRIDPLNGSIHIRRGDIPKLVHEGGPTQLNATACCDDLCDHSTLFVQFAPDPASLQISVSAQNDHFQILPSDRVGTAVGFVAVESNIDGIATCSVAPPGLVSLRRLSDRSFLLVSGREETNGTARLDLICDIDGRVFSSKEVWVEKRAARQHQPRPPTSHKQFTFVMTLTIIGVMLMAFSIFLVVKCRRVCFRGKPVDLSVNRRVLPSLSAERREDASSLCGSYVVRDELRLFHDFVESTV